MNRIVDEWEEETIFHGADHFFEELEKEIGRARRSIAVEMYIFNDDACGRRIIDALKAAAARGVSVRILIDGIGSPFFTLHFFKELTHAGIDCRIYHPAPWSLLGMNRAPAFAVRLFALLNKRNHRKVIHIDEHIAWVGSMNVSAVHLGPSGWRDSGIRVKGPEVSVLLKAFNIAWDRRNNPYHRVFQARRRARESRSFWTTHLVRLNLHMYLRRRNRAEILRRIRSAKERVWITNPYFVPPRSHLRAIRSAARRGCDVKVLVSRKSDIFFMPWVIATYYRGLFRHNVRIFEFLPRVLHAKILIIDDWMILGSSNLNHRSVIHDLEVDIVVTKNESRKSIEDQFTRDLAESEEITIRTYRSILERAIGRISLYLRHWM